MTISHLLAVERSVHSNYTPTFLLVIFLPEDPQEKTCAKPLPGHCGAFSGHLPSLLCAQHPYLLASVSSSSQTCPPHTRVVTETAWVPATQWWPCHTNGALAWLPLQWSCRTCWVPRCHHGDVSPHLPHPRLCCSVPCFGVNVSDGERMEPPRAGR